MKFIIAPDSYKGSLTAMEVADIIERGILNYNKEIEVLKVPIADGGEGTVQALVDATGGKIIKASVLDPLLRPIEAAYGILGDNETAVIEMATASGLPLLKPHERDPLHASTYGTGQLLIDALNRNCRKFIIGIGGSATNDGGTGMLKALGVKFLDEYGQEIKEGGIELAKLHSIDLSNFDKRIEKCEIKVACDVDNPLCGLNGASHIFGPQKGATAEMIKLLDEALMQYAVVVKESLGVDILNVKGAGAAGGLGGAFVGFLNGKLERGINIIMKQVELSEKLKDADLVITGEGQIDYQTCFGKAPYGVAMEAKKNNIPVVAIVGSIGEGAETLYNRGFDSIFSIVDKPMSLEEAMRDGSKLLEATAERVVRLFMLDKLESEIGGFYE